MVIGAYFFDIGKIKMENYTTAKAFMDKIMAYYESNQPELVVQVVESMSKEDLDTFYFGRDFLLGELAVAYNNLGRYDDAFNLLMSLEIDEEDYEWYYRVGFALYYLAEEDKDVAHAWEKSLQAKQAFEHCLRYHPDKIFVEECKEFIEWINLDQAFYQRGEKAPLRS